MPGLQWYDAYIYRDDVCFYRDESNVQKAWLRRSCFRVLLHVLCRLLTIQGLFDRPWLLLVMVVIKV